MQEGGDHAEDGEECGPMEGKHWAWRDRGTLVGSPVTEAAGKMQSPKHASLVTAGPSPKTCSEALSSCRKQLATQLFSFCTDGGWSGGVQVEKDGTGLRQVWKRQIQQFNRVSSAVAAAVAEAYPSPSLLLQVSP